MHEPHLIRLQCSLPPGTPHPHLQPLCRSRDEPPRDEPLSDAQTHYGTAAILSRAQRSIIEPPATHGHGR